MSAARRRGEGWVERIPGYANGVGEYGIWIKVPETRPAHDPSSDPENVYDMRPMCTTPVRLHPPHASLRVYAPPVRSQKDRLYMPICGVQSRTMLTCSPSALHNKRSWINHARARRWKELSIMHGVRDRCGPLASAVLRPPGGE
jgi:hypothetical protein